MTDYPKTLTEALVKLQADLPRIGKTETANTGSYSYSYADLATLSAAIFPRLAQVGLAYVVTTMYDDTGRFVLAYSLVHVSGEERQGVYPLPSSGSPQAIGSAMTYGRRYCLCAVTGIAPDEDDDGRAAAAEHADRQGSARRPAQQRAAEEPGQPADGDSLNATRARLWEEAQRQGHTSSKQFAEMFAEWSGGTSIAAADRELLTRCIAALQTGQLPPTEQEGAAA